MAAPQPSPTEASSSGPAPRLAAPSPIQQLAPVAIALALLPGERGTLRLALEPPELGRVEVRIQRGADGADTVRILAERPETLALLQRDRGELGRALDQAGTMAPGGISLGLTGQEGGGAGGDARQAGRQDRPAPPPSAAPAQITANEQRTLAMPGLLDIAV